MKVVSPSTYQALIQLVGCFIAGLIIVGMLTFSAVRGGQYARLMPALLFWPLAMGLMLGMLVLSLIIRRRDISDDKSFCSHHWGERSWFATDWATGGLSEYEYFTCQDCGIRVEVREALPRYIQESSFPFTMHYNNAVYCKDEIIRGIIE